MHCDFLPQSSCLQLEFLCSSSDSWSHLKGGEVFPCDQDQVATGIHGVWNYFGTSMFVDSFGFTCNCVDKTGEIYIFTHMIVSLYNDGKMQAALFWYHALAGHHPSCVLDILLLGRWFAEFGIRKPQGVERRAK
jgi:hypothetical protein